MKNFAQKLIAHGLEFLPILLINSLAAADPKNAKNCILTATQEPPFYVFDANGQRDSLVRLRSRLNSRLAQVDMQGGGIGFIYPETLVRPSAEVEATTPQKGADYLFEIKKDVIFHSALTARQFLKLATVKDKIGQAQAITRFRTRECCEGKNCKTEYLFLPLPLDRRAPFKGFYFDPNDQAVWSGVLLSIEPIQSGNIKTIVGVIQQPKESKPATWKLLSADKVEQAGDTPGKYIVAAQAKEDPDLVRLGMIRALGNEWFEAPFGSTHYNARPWDSRRKETAGTREAMCAFAHVLRDHQSKCKPEKNGEGCKLIWGDFYSPTWEGAHEGHFKGTCVDVLYFKGNDGHYNGGYSRLPQNEHFKNIVAGYDGKILEHINEKFPHMHICFPLKATKFVYSSMLDCVDNRSSHERVGQPEY